jgi:5-methyltetrahydrofolate--homocysteine methyltransferase
VAFQLATMGPAISTATAELFAKNAYREYLELHGLSVQLTEALAEYWHVRVRRELGIAAADPAELAGFFDVRYQGARYSIGYPACPDLADRAKVARLLDPARIGVELSEEMQLHPEQSTDAIVVHHPQAKYFSV